MTNRRYLLLFFIACVGILGLVQTAFAQGATLYFLPASSQVSAGQSFSASVFVDTKGEVINAVAAHFSYPDALLEVVGVQPEAGLIEFQKSAGAGTVQIDVGKTQPYITGMQRIAIVTFRARPATSGTALLTFGGDAAVLRNSDSQNVLSLPDSSPGTFRIAASSGGETPPATPPTPPAPPSTEAELEIMEIRATQSSEGVEVFWKTNREARGRIHYGPLQEAGEQQDYPFSVLEGTFLEAHSLLLPHALSLEGYTLEIIATDRQGNQAKTERLVLAQLIASESAPEQEQERPLEPPILEEGRGRLALFILAPIVVLLLAGGLLFWRMRIGS